MRFLVERSPCRSSLRWPLAVAIDFGKCLRTMAEVRPGHVQKNPLSIAAHHVVTVGLNAAACRKVISSRFVCMLYALFAVCVLLVCRVCIVVDCGVIGMSHNPVALFLFPMLLASY